jgi:Methyltransferase domain
MQWPAVQRLFIIFRRRRMRAFYKRFQPTTQTRLLDIGGAPLTWLQESPCDGEFAITLANISLLDLPPSRFPVVECDAVNLPFADNSFDIAFSNSVIEHMTTWERQKMFASEARRVAKALWIQTPARSFPIESHMLAPFFQYLPRSLQRRMARYFTLRGLLIKPTPEEIDAILSDIRLLTFKEMQQLFPDCTILKERVFGLTKSYVAIRA